MCIPIISQNALGLPACPAPPPPSCLIKGSSGDREEQVREHSWIHTHLSPLPGKWPCDSWSYWTLSTHL